MPSGIIIVDKPSDWTSHDVVAKLRGCLKERRIGHAGTLDPMATGVLPVFVGRATRAVEFAVEGEKEYIAGLRLGIVTDTQDITGTTLSTCEELREIEAVRAVLPQFTGEIAQIPPMFSAIKMQGKKLYELARAGKTVERAPRNITIHEIELLEQTSQRDFLLRVSCSKGTYIRTLCHDIGETLGVGACLYSLRRTMAAGFTEAQSIPLSAIVAAADPQSLLLPIDEYFSIHPTLQVEEADMKKIRNGMQIPSTAPDGLYRVYFNEEFLMLAQVEHDLLTTVKSFFEVK